ncbi:MAG: helix-turn-helix domain-containing protein [Planctomycetes bacterium]|nr:helix-turn-helix domain-containing protein [Planctomycetota bacterium]
MSCLESLSTANSHLKPILIGYTRCAPNYEFVQRRLPEHLIYQVCEHDLHATFADQERIVSAGELLWVPPGCEHTFRPARAGTQILVYHYRFETESTWPVDHEVVLSSNAGRMLRCAELHDGSAFDDPLWLLRFRASLVLTFAEIAAHCSQDQEGASCFSPEQRRKIIHGVQENAWTDPERLAILLDYHPAYFTRIFKRSFGEAPRSWIVQQRMQRAANILLEENGSILSIAEGIGYTDQFLFSRQFKQFIGCSPRDWRKKHLAPHQEVR